MATYFSHFVSLLVDSDSERAFIGPVCQVAAAINAHLLTYSQNQIPFLDFRVPETFRIAEVLFLTNQYGVALVFLEGLAVISRNSHRLNLHFFSCRGIESYNTIIFLIYNA